MWKGTKPCAEESRLWPVWRDSGAQGVGTPLVQSIRLGNHNHCRKTRSFLFARLKCTLPIQSGSALQIHLPRFSACKRKQSKASFRQRSVSKEVVNMTIKQFHCGEQDGHDWHYTGKPKRYQEWFNSVIRIPVRCSKCGLDSVETYIYANTVPVRKDI